MKDSEKAERYNQLIAEGDVIQRELSKLQSANAGVSTTSKEYEDKVGRLRSRLARLEQEMTNLFR
jgi:predicted  nucleic acid-binding Zn-ribbon protein